MAKQTNTGGAYQNYQIIKNGDTTGSSEALAKGIATFTDSIAKNSKARAVANEEFQKQFKAAKKEASAQSDARAIIRQESILNAGNTIKDSGISAKMQKQYTTAMEIEIVRVADWSKNVDSPYSTPNEKKEAHQKILEAKQRIASLNKSLGVAGQLRANSNINSERRQSQGTNWNYNPKITRDASGNVENIDYSYSQNMEYVLNGGSGADVELTQEEDGPWNITSKTNKEHVGKGNLDFDISIPNFIDPDFKLTTDYTPVIPNASQRVVNGAMAQLEGKPTDKMDPKMLESIVSKGEDGKPGKIRYIDENGKAWDAINNPLFTARALASSTVAVSEFQGINNVNDSNNVLLDQLGMTPESWEVATNGKADTLKGMEEQVGEQVFKRTEELAMSALNFKKFDGVIYRVSDNQPEKPTVTKATALQIERRSTLNPIYNNITKISTGAAFEAKMKANSKSTIADRIITSLAIDPTKGMKLTATADGNLSFAKKVLDEAAMAEEPMEIINTEGKSIKNPKYNKDQYKEVGIVIDINTGNRMTNINNLYAWLKVQYSLSTEQAEDLAITFLNKK